MLPFTNVCNATHFLLVRGKDVIRLPLFNVTTHFLLDIRKRCSDVTAFHQNVKCHSQAVGHMKRCDKTAFHKMCNITNSLLVMGKEVMRLPFTKSCNVTHSLLITGQDDDMIFNKNVTHSLLVTGKDVMRLFHHILISLTFCQS